MFSTFSVTSLCRIHWVIYGNSVPDMRYLPTHLHSCQYTQTIIFSVQSPAELDFELWERNSCIHCMYGNKRIREKWIWGVPVALDEAGGAALYNCVHVKQVGQREWRV